MTFMKPAARAAVLLSLAIAASSAMAGRDKDDDDDKGGHGHCGRHGKPPCTVPISGTISLVPLALLAAVAAPAIMNRRRRVVTTKT